MSPHRLPPGASRALFPPWTNTIVRLGVLVGVGVVVGTPTLLMLWERTAYTTGQYDPIMQPVQFDHRHHVRDDGIACRYCHYAVARSPYAGVPPTELCMSCHAQIWNTSPLLAPIRRSYFTGEAVRWTRVHNLPDFVFFNHSVHVTRGVGCVSCHGRVDLMGQVFAVAPLTMSWCLDCHREPERHLRPLDRITDMEWVPSRPPIEVGREIKRELDVNPPMSCTGCHR